MVAADPLIDLAHLRQFQLGVELGLPDKDDLQPALRAEVSERMRVSSINGSDRFCASSMMTTTKASSGERVEELGEQITELGARGLPQAGRW